MLEALFSKGGRLQCLPLQYFGRWGWRRGWCWFPRSVVISFTKGHVCQAWAYPLIVRGRWHFLSHPRCCHALSGWTISLNALLYPCGVRRPRLTHGCFCFWVAWSSLKLPSGHIWATRPNVSTSSCPRLVQSALSDFRSNGDRLSKGLRWSVLVSIIPFGDWPSEDLRTFPRPSVVRVQWGAWAHPLGVAHEPRAFFYELIMKLTSAAWSCLSPGPRGQYIGTYITCFLL